MGSLGSSLDNVKGWDFEVKKTVAKPVELKLPEKHFLVLKMEKRLGKPVSIVGPFFLSKEALLALCSRVKKKLGSGGTCKEEWLEFQGECREKLRTLLSEQGFGSLKFKLFLVACYGFTFSDNNQNIACI